MKLSEHRLKLYRLLILTLFGVLMYVSQVIMSSLPNIEIVSLFIILVTRKFGVRALYSVYIFAFCEILTYGIHIWAINYLYVWTILLLALLPIRKYDSVFLYIVIAGIFGLLFGTLCSIPYFITGGFAFGLSYIISGIPFDFLHLIGNVLSVALLYKPLTLVMNKIN